MIAYGRRRRCNSFSIDNPREVERNGCCSRGDNTLATVFSVEYLAAFAIDVPVLGESRKKKNDKSEQIAKHLNFPTFHSSV